MPRIAYVNGQYLPHHQAAVHIEDRGFQFADGVYEVVALREGHLADMRGHLDRLWRSMGELRLPPPMSRPCLIFHIREMVRRNRLRNGMLYIQITRGVAARDFRFPHNTPVTLVMSLRAADLNHHKWLQTGIAVCSTQDQRWARRDIKSIALLPQVLAKQKAAEAGCYEVWMLDAQGYVTEGGSSNAWIVRGKTVITRQANRDILKGVTRTALITLLREAGYTLTERPFTLEEAYAADEAFITGATTLLLPITKLDARIIGTGQPGSVALYLRQAYEAYAQRPEEEQAPWIYAESQG